MPYVDLEKRKAYRRAYNKRWDKDNKIRRQRYKHKYRRAWERTCKHCGARHLDRRWKCPQCGVSSRGPKQPVVYRRCAPTGPCLICNQERKLHRDHDHATGKFRGLICNNCNAGLGMFHDNVTSLKRAARYVEKAGKLSGVPTFQ